MEELHSTATADPAPAFADGAEDGGENDDEEISEEARALMARRFAPDTRARRERFQRVIRGVLIGAAVVTLLAGARATILP
jgi:hypothetical protein